MPRLTTADCNKLIQSTDKLRKIADGGGLYLFIKGKGRAYWSYQYRDRTRLSKNGKPAFTSHGLGSFPDVTPKMAREALEAYRVSLRSGTALTPTARQARPAPVGKTFTDALEMWLSANQNTWAAKGVAARRGLAKLSLATHDIAAITQADVLVALKDETPRQHMEKRGWLAALFSYAKAQGWRNDDNPARFDADTRHGFAKIEKGNHHGSVPASTLPALMKKLRKDDSDAARALMFQILTAARPGMVENATWSQIYKKGANAPAPPPVDQEILKGDAWIILPSGMKTGKVRPVPHRVPLAPAVRTLLGEPGKPDALLFPSLVSNALLNVAKKYDAPTAHGMRSSFRNWAGQRGRNEREYAELTMGHKLPGASEVERAYATDDLLEQRRPLGRQWAEFLL